ncbi:MAG: LLM class flavin-dependent oxidoreductase [Candidatus Nezhaarchaeales archaeon]
MVVRFGVEGPNYPWEVIGEATVLAEKLGFDSYWMPDHIVATGVRRWDALEAWGTLCALALKTSRIKLATGVSDTYRYHPAVLAQKATTCDIISGGRAILGVGIGEAMNLVPYGIAYDKPVSRTEEALQIVRRLWTQDFVDFDGKYYKLRKAFLQPKPVQKPHIPIYVAASSPRTMELVAKYGDGWLPANLLPDEYKAGLERIKSLAKGLGRDPEAIDPAHFMYVVVSKNREEARKSILLPAKMLLLTRPRILEKIGVKPPTYEFEMTFKLVFPEHGEAWLNKAKEIPDEVVDKAPFIYGAPEDAIEKLDRYVKAGCKHFVINFQVSPKVLKETMQLFAEKVLTYFKGG